MHGDQFVVDRNTRQPLPGAKAGARCLPPEAATLHPVPIAEEVMVGESSTPNSLRTSRSSAMAGNAALCYPCCSSKSLFTSFRDLQEESGPFTYHTTLVSVRLIIKPSTRNGLRQSLVVRRIAGLKRPYHASRTAFRGQSSGRLKIS